MQPFPLFSGIISSSTKWLLNPEMKAKCKRYLDLLFSFPVFFHIIPLQPSYPRSWTSKITWVCNTIMNINVYMYIYIYGWIWVVLSLCSWLGGQKRDLISGIFEVAPEWPEDQSLSILVCPRKPVRPEEKDEGYQSEAEWHSESRVRLLSGQLGVRLRSKKLES